MTRIYCGGELSKMREEDGWWWCGGCGQRLWLVDRTFTVDKERLSSEHGYQAKDRVEDDAAEVKADARSRRGKKAGDV